MSEGNKINVQVLGDSYGWAFNGGSDEVIIEVKVEGASIDSLRQAILEMGDACAIEIFRLKKALKEAQKNV